METRVAIIGVGNFGQALAFVLSSQKETLVELWDVDTSKVAIQRDLPEVAREANIILVCVPSGALRSVLESIRDHITPETIIISCAKGMDQEHLVSDQLLEVALLMGQPWALLSGPMLASEMTAGMFSFATLSTPDRQTFEDIRRVFAGTTLRLEYSDDPHGVALAGVLKNIYAICFGIVQALRLGNNVQGSLVMQACREMAQVITDFGGRPETAWGLAGLADLVATGFSDTSRNCRVGKELVELGECQTVSEGLRSLPNVMALLGKKLEMYPVLSAVDAVINKGMPAREAIARLMALRYEREKAEKPA